MAKLDELVGVLKAAGEVTRMRLLALLAEGELSVKDLTEILGQSQPRVSRHLKLLADANLISRHAEGAWAYYRLDTDSEAGALGWQLVQKFDPEDAERQRDRERLDWVRKAQQAQATAYFSTVAESWDALRNMHVPEAAVEAAIVAEMEGRSVDVLLDLGTGTGRMLELLAGHYKRGVGLDSSREMIAVARAKLASAGIGHAQARLGDIVNIDPAVGRADMIVLHQVLHYFDDPGRLLAQMRPSLKPAGEMLIVDFAPHDHEFLRTHNAHRRLGLSEAQMAGWARATGMRVATYKSFPKTDDPAGLTVCLWRLVGTQGQETDQ